MINMLRLAWTIQFITIYYLLYHTWQEYFYSTYDHMLIPVCGLSRIKVTYKIHTNCFYLNAQSRSRSNLDLDLDSRLRFIWKVEKRWAFNIRVLEAHGMCQNLDAFLAWKYHRKWTRWHRDEIRLHISSDGNAVDEKGRWLGTWGWFDRTSSTERTHPRFRFDIDF